MAHKVKCNQLYDPDLPKFEFSKGGGYSSSEKSQSAKIYLNLNFSGGGGILQVKSHKVPRST